MLTVRSRYETRDYRTKGTPIRDYQKPPVGDQRISVPAGMGKTPMIDKPTGAPPREVGGHIWRCYHTGIMRTEWRTDGGLWAVGRRGETGSYWARIGIEYLPTRFRSLDSAMRAAIKATKGVV